MRGFRFQSIPWFASGRPPESSGADPPQRAGFFVEAPPRRGMRLGRGSCFSFFPPAEIPDRLVAGLNAEKDPLFDSQLRRVLYTKSEVSASLVAIQENHGGQIMHPFNSPLKTWIIRAAALISVFGTVFGSTGATHPFSIHDMLAMERISDMQVSPDGTRILFSLRTTDLEANKGRTDVWLIGADGKNLRRLTSHPASDFNARWSSCGRCVFFLSTRSGSAQVWRIKIDGGEAEQVTHLPLDAGNLVVSQAGDLIAFTLDVFPGETPAATAKRLEEIHNAKATGRLYDRLFIRHWDTWSDGRRSHLFVMSKRGGEAKDLMPSMDADTPHKPFGGPEEIAFTPDGKGLVFTARDAGREEAWSTNHDLFYVPADGSKAPARLTGDNKAWDTTPVFSPDGKTLAYLAMARPDYEADRFRIVLRPWPGGKDRVLTESWDYSVGSMCWSADGTKILVSAADRGQTALFAVDAGTAKAERIVGQGTVDGFGPAGERIVFQRHALKSPTEIYSIGSDGTGERPVTAINAAKIGAARMGEYEQYSFKGWNNETVYGYVVKPADFDAAGKYPRRFPHPRRTAGILRKRLSLPVESPSLRRSRLRRRHGRFPRFDRIRAGLLRFDPGRLGRKAARGPEKRPGRGSREISLDGRIPGRSPRRLVRRIHDQLDRRGLAGRVQVPGEP